MATPNKKSDTPASDPDGFVSQTGFTHPDLDRTYATKEEAQAALDEKNMQGDLDRLEVALATTLAATTQYAKEGGHLAAAARMMPVMRTMMLAGAIDIDPTVLPGYVKDMAGKALPLKEKKPKPEEGQGNLDVGAGDSAQAETGDASDGDQAATKEGSS